MPRSFLSVSIQMEVVVCVFHVARSSCLIPFNHFDKFSPFFRAVRWRVWCRQKSLSYCVAQRASVVTNLTSPTEQLSGLLTICLSFDWVTDMWMAEWLASFQSGWQADWLSALLTEWLTVCLSESLTDCLAGRLTGYVVRLASLLCVAIGLSGDGCCGQVIRMLTHSLSVWLISSHTGRLVSWQTAAKLLRTEVVFGSFWRWTVCCHPDRSRKKMVLDKIMRALVNSVWVTAVQIWNTSSCQNNLKIISVSVN